MFQVFAFLGQRGVCIADICVFVLPLTVSFETRQNDREHDAKTQILHEVSAQVQDQRLTGLRDVGTYHRYKEERNRDQEKNFPSRLGVC